MFDLILLVCLGINCHSEVIDHDLTGSDCMEQVDKHPDQALFCNRIPDQTVKVGSYKTLCTAYCDDNSDL